MTVSVNTSHSSICNWESTISNGIEFHWAGNSTSYSLDVLFCQLGCDYGYQQINLIFPIQLNVCEITFILYLRYACRVS